MILKWIQKVVSGSRNHTHFDSDPLPPSSLIDVAHEVLAKEALEKQLALSGLEKYGWPFVQRQRFQQKVKTKVKHFLSFADSDENDSELVDEVTERITEAAEVDSYYKRLFDDAAEKK